MLAPKITQIYIFSFLRSVIAPRFNLIFHFYDSSFLYFVNLYFCISIAFLVMIFIQPTTSLHRPSKLFPLLMVYVHNWLSWRKSITFNNSTRYYRNITVFPPIFHIMNCLSNESVNISLKRKKNQQIHSMLCKTGMARTEVRCSKCAAHMGKCSRSFVHKVSQCSGF